VDVTRSDGSLATFPRTVTTVSFIAVSLSSRAAFAPLADDDG